MGKRIGAIESARFIAAFAVICIHYFYSKDKDLTLIVNQIARFAVPFFFVVSGYFLAEKLKTNDKPIVYWNYIKKLLFLYIAWQLIYFINPPTGEIYIRGFWKAYNTKLHSVIDQRWDYIAFKGWSQHLWFFFSLALTTAYFLLFRTKRVYLMVVISFILYIIGALTKAYVKSSIGIPVETFGLPPKFNTNNLIFFSALPFSLGVMFSIKPIRITLIPALLILIVGYALHFGEIWYLGEIKLRQRVDYVFSTFLLGVGVFLVAKNSFKPLEWKPLASLGKYSLGIYAMHVLLASWIHTFIVNNMGNSFIATYKTYQYLFLPVFILIACTLVTFALSKIPFLKRLV